MRSVIWTSSFFMFLSFFNIKDLANTRKCIIFALVNCLLTKKIKYMADSRIIQLRMLQNSFFLETQLKAVVMKFIIKLMI